MSQSNNINFRDTEENRSKKLRTNMTYGWGVGRPSSVSPSRGPSALKKGWAGVGHDPEFP